MGRPVGSVRKSWRSVEGGSSVPMNARVNDVGFGDGMGYCSLVMSSAGSEGELARDRGGLDACAGRICSSVKASAGKGAWEINRYCRGLVVPGIHSQGSGMTARAGRIIPPIISDPFTLLPLPDMLLLLNMVLPDISLPTIALPVMRLPFMLWSLPIMGSAKSLSPASSVSVMSFNASKSILLLLGILDMFGND